MNLGTEVHTMVCKPQGVNKQQVVMECEQCDRLILVDVDESQMKVLNPGNPYATHIEFNYKPAFRVPADTIINKPPTRRNSYRATVS